VVAFEPDFRQVTELVVFSDFPNWQVAMVVKDGLRLRKTVKQARRSAALQQEIVGDEGHSECTILHAPSLAHRATRCEYRSVERRANRLGPKLASFGR